MSWKHEQALVEFHNAMAAVLDENDEKGKRGWDDLDPGYCEQRIDEEFQEVLSAFRKDDIKATRRELLDVANFAFLWWYNLEREL